jgi:4-amino-4-deoxy-L-arabinose transferase-like glycosyltransferase
MKVNLKPILNRYYGALTLLIILAAVLRFVNLGYSDYQGDEIKAIFLPAQGQSIWDFLLAQRKGPMQFVVTYVLRFIDPSYNNEFLVRFPFALAGVVSVYFFYKLVREHFGNRISLYATLFFITNGFLIAFSRMAQYQSLVLVFMLGALYFFSSASSNKAYETKGIFLGFIFWSLSLLSHYDGVFIGPFAAYLIYSWWKTSSYDKRKKLILLGFGAGIFVAVLASFYIPFVLGLTDKTLDYWSGRITGDVSGKISSSLYLFSVYQPIYVVHFYKILAGLGALLTLLTFLQNKRFINKLIGKFHIMTIYNKKALIALILWLLPAVFFMEKIVYIPGTHIYTYLIPLFVFLAFGLYLVENVMRGVVGINIGRSVFIYGMVVLFTFIYLQSYAVFVDNKVEYPWREEKFFFWTFPVPNSMYHLSMFGFPYYRNWEGIRDFVKSAAFEPTISAYSTNERSPLARYYVNLEKSSDKAGVYIYVKDPQSFANKIVEEKPQYWVSKYDPAYTLSRNGEEIVRVYLMVPGSLEVIRNMGY